MENSLEKLAVEWYNYKGFYVKRNVYFGTSQKGGVEGEIDVFAYHPKTKEAIHIEAAVPESYKKTGEHHKRKFESAQKYYKAFFNVDPNSVKRISLILTGSQPKQTSIEKIESVASSKFIHIKDLINEIIEEMKNLDENSMNIVKETYPLLRLIYILSHFNYLR